MKKDSMDLRDAREQAGLTQRELAAAVGTSQSAVSVAERDPGGVGVAKMQRLLVATGHELAIKPLDGAVDPSDLELMVLALTQTPEARLASFEENAGPPPDGGVAAPPSGP